MFQTDLENQGEQRIVIMIVGLVIFGSISFGGSLAVYRFLRQFDTLVHDIGQIKNTTNDMAVEMKVFGSEQTNLKKTVGDHESRIRILENKR